MDARVYITPRFTDESSFQPEIEVTEDVIGAVRIDQRIEKNKWSHGQLAAGRIDFTLNNSTRRYGASTDPNSIFSLAGADGTRVRIAYPTARPSANAATSYVNVWRGRLTSKAMRHDVNLGTAKWVARTPDSSLRDSELGAGSIAAGRSLRQALDAVFNIVEVADSFTSVETSAVVDPNAAGGDTLVQDEAPLLGEDRSAYEAAQKLLRVSDSIFAYSPTEDILRVVPRGQYPTTTRHTIRNVLDIAAVEDGSEQVYNQVVVKTGIDSSNQEEYRSEHRGSISHWGLRTLDVDLSWVKNFSKAVRIADYLRDRLAFPHRLIELRVDGWEIPPADLYVGQVLTLDVNASAPEAAPVYGRARYRGDPVDRYSRETHAKLHGEYYVEQLERELATNTVSIRLRTR